MEALDLNADDHDGDELENVASLTLYVILGGGIVVVMVAVVFMKVIANSQEKMAVDDQKYIAVVMYMVQIADMLSDLLFALQESFCFCSVNL